MTVWITRSGKRLGFETHLHRGCRRSLYPTASRGSFGTPSDRLRCHGYQGVDIIGLQWGWGYDGYIVGWYIGIYIYIIYMCLFIYVCVYIYVYLCGMIHPMSNMGIPMYSQFYCLWRTCFFSTNGWMGHTMFRHTLCWTKEKRRCIQCEAPQL
jgi:hypothetical protein